MGDAAAIASLKKDMANRKGVLTRHRGKARRLVMERDITGLGECMDAMKRTMEDIDQMFDSFVNLCESAQ